MKAIQWGHRFRSSKLKGKNIYIKNADSSSLSMMRFSHLLQETLLWGGRRELLACVNSGSKYQRAGVSSTSPPVSMEDSPLRKPRSVTAKVDPTGSGTAEVGTLAFSGLPTHTGPGTGAMSPSGYHVQHPSTVFQKAASP